MKKLEKPEFIRVHLYTDPDSPAAYAKYSAVLIAGNYMYGEVILLKELEINDREECIFQLNTPVELCEWEWCPFILEEKEKREAEALYNALQIGKNQTV